MKRQKIKGAYYTQTGIINRLKYYYSLSTNEEVKEGLIWYKKAHTFAALLAEKYNIPLIQVCGIIAALSPQVTWDQNRKLTIDFLNNGWVNNTTKLRNYKCLAILETTDENNILEILSPSAKFLKSRKFFINIYDYRRANDVTIDRHAIAAAIQPHTQTAAISEAGRQISTNQYKFIESAFLRTAEIIGVKPHELQAVTWLTYRRLRELPNHKKEIF